jgi:hypothetical protein
MGGTDISQLGLTQAIVDSRRELGAKFKMKKPKLQPTKASIQIKFGVTRTSGGTLRSSSWFSRLEEEQQKQLERQAQEP